MNLEAYISNLFSDPDMAKMGHGQSTGDLNLGLGWIYYALARSLRPEFAVVIGSYRGFVPSVIAKGLLDNETKGSVAFIDPSLVDDFWADPERVASHFQQLGTPNVVHHKYTTQEFVQTENYAALANIGLFMIDGYHTAEQARLDYLAFLPKLSEQAVTLFHDSVSAKRSTIYGKENGYQHTVSLFIERLESTPGLEVITLPVGKGVSLVKGRPQSLETIEKPF